MEQFYGGEMDPGVAAAAAAVASFDAMERDDDRAGGIGHGLLDDDGPLSFYATDFPPMPEFPCMSSSSSSSSARAPAKATSSSSSSSASSATSWAVLRLDQDADRSPALQQPAVPPPAAPMLSSALSSTESMDVILSENRFEEAPCKDDEEVALEDCLDVMETFGYMDLLECNDLFDPSSIFQTEEPATDPTAATNNGYLVEEFQLQHHLPQDQPEQNIQQQEGADAHGHPASAAQPCEQPQPQPVVVVREATDEMGQVLLEWLRTNRDSISAEDLRRVKIKKATIESAAQRLGGGKAAMKQLLKLILEWVQTNHLHRKQKEAAEAQNNNLHYSPFQDLSYQGSFPSPSPNPNMLNTNTNCYPPEPSSCFSQPQWASPYMSDQAGSAMAAPPSFNPSTVGYISGDLFSSNGDLYPGPPGLAEYHMLESPQSWLLPQFGPAAHYNNFMTADANFQPPAAQAFVGYGNNSHYSNFQQQYYNGGSGERSLMRIGSSATKEARKKRMARQRRLMSHHHHRSGGGHHSGHHANHQNGHHQAVMSVDHQQHARAMGGCDQAAAAAAANSGNWVYWPPQTQAVAAPAPPPMLPPEAIQFHQPVERQPATVQGQSGQRGQVTAPDRRQGWKPENNLKFLLQKVLKQSDVGNLGRIVLPKKEAETHLPELEARDGISISMEDIGTSRVWNMRYRFWPNNKSRMYLLENTGDFVRANGLQEGDFIVIYLDVKCGKYLIRGVKVRQAEGGAKSDPKRPENGKPQRNSNLQGTTSSTAAGNAAQSK